MFFLKPIKSDVLEFRISVIFWTEVGTYTMYLTHLVRSIIKHNVKFTESHMNIHTKWEKNYKEPQI